MTARLRELTENWLTRASNLTVDPRDKRRCAIGQSYRDCADELLSILDAEGDGGAVGEAVAEVYECPRDHHEPVPTLLKGIRFTGVPLPVGTKLYTQPTRSGGVSDADVRECADIHFKSLTGDAIDRSPGDQDVDLMQAELDQAMRAALTHFAKGERHE